ncbi:MAG: FAD-binding protein, partial [Coriobacteriales bacterium]|nr:FAD-binding protein [Coriobacteriales bacterium]
MMRTELDRRAFLKGAVVSAVGVGAASAMVACSPATTGGDDTASGTGGTGGDAPAAEGSGWKTPPAELTNFAKEYDFDVVCVGHGYAGLCSCRELAESGRKVALIEKQAEETYAATGNESCSFNSKLLDRLDIPHIDPVEYYQNWMAIAANYPNPELIMKFCQNVGEAS